MIISQRHFTSVHFELPCRLKETDKIHTKGLSKFHSNICSILFECRSFSDLSNSLNSFLGCNDGGCKNVGLEANIIILYLSVFASKIIIKRISVQFFLLHKTCWVDSTLGSPNWTVRLKACTVHVLPARIMQLLDWGCFYQTNNQ